MKPGFYKVADYAIEVQDAWELYRNTRESLLKEQLLGETKMRTDVELMQNFGTASGTKTTAERGLLKEGKTFPPRPSRPRSAARRRRRTCCERARS